MEDESGVHKDEEKEQDEQSAQEDEIEQKEEIEETDEQTQPSGSKVESKEILEDIYDYENLEYAEYEHVPIYEKDWEEGERTVSSETIDWEKEAKQTVHLGEIPRERRKTIFELDSYVSSGPSVAEISKITSEDFVTEKPRKGVRYSDSLGAPGVARIDLSPLTQKVIGCVIGENISTEYPWVYIRKEIIQDNIDLHEESSDFLPIEKEIRKYPDTKFLFGYVPSLTEEGQFYICLTEEGRDLVLDHIQQQREEHENRVRTAIFRPLGKWEDLSSSVEIESGTVKKNRPLLEIEVVGTADILNVPIQLEDRNVEDIRDGYIELLPYRETFENVSRELLHDNTQVTPFVRDMEAQTALSVPRNCWAQYEYEYESPDIANFNEVQAESLRSFLRHVTDDMCDQLLLNATWDIYINDYAHLVRNVTDTQYPIPKIYEEHLSFHDEKHVIDKVINDLCWHPLWSGIAIAAYTSYAKSQSLIGPKSDVEVIKASENNFVLVWSFDDCLTPKLVLECPREVTSVAVNPLDGNLIVGGCANGQIVLWDIPGRIEKVEAVVVRTAAQIKHRYRMKSLTTWMKEMAEAFLVQPTAMSSLKESHKAPVTQVIWISPYDKLNTDGRITSLPEDATVDELSSQFVTASEDGTIAFWDLNLEKWQSHARKRQKAESLVTRPEALVKSISPFKKLDRVFKPHYVLKIQHPIEGRSIVISTITMYSKKFQKERADVLPPAKDVTERRFFRNIIKKPDVQLQPFIHVGTVEGDFGCITWEGYDFTTDLAINTETCTWNWFKKVHDGPITHSVRSKQNPSWIATIGGKIFAVWKEGFVLPQLHGEVFVLRF